ncbi:hypothetical protein [Miltoncostaea marina]|uniref:hypothetical protein n=1 Tax=Miltoncostaea marina TaxID=2843215 RepID=UPI001C3D0E13|nr:hypothetical protein [Miltoncostaea marina]
MGRTPSSRLLALALAGAAAAALCGTAPAAARDDGRGRDDDRVEVRVAGACGRASRAELRLRAEDGRIRADLRVRTPTAGRWRVTVVHERRLVARARVRATRSARGFAFRVTLPDYTGPDAVRVRAAAPRGETCSAAATVAGS